MPSKKPPDHKAAIKALAELNLSAADIQIVASRIGEMPVSEIEMLLFKRERKLPEPVPEAGSDMVALVAKLRTASRRRTNAEILALIADELEEEGRVDSSRAIQHIGRETVAQWLARVGRVVPDQTIRECLEKLLVAYANGTRLRRVK